MSGFDKFLGDVVAPLWEKRDGVDFRDRLAFLEESQRWLPERLVELQTQKLNRILYNAYLNTTFYRDRLDRAGYDPDVPWTLVDLQRIPILEKDEIRANREAMTSSQYPPEDLFPKRTGGSTSVPLQLWWGPEARNWKAAATWRHNRWAGFTMGSPLAMVWGNEPEPEGVKAKLRRATYERYFALDTLKMTAENMREFAHRCRKQRPKFIMGHAHSIFLFADFCRQKGIADLSFDGAITTAMVLRESEREVIEQVLNTQVFNRYGCEEMSVIASECADRGLHIHAEGLIVEVVRGNEPAPPGEFGDLVITDLTNHAMPLIRYRIGDVSALEPEPCTCERKLPRLKEVRGRTADFLLTPEGNRVFGISVLDTMMIHFPGLKQAQIVQDELGLLRIRLAVRDGERLDTDAESDLAGRLSEFFGPTMRYDFEYVDRILPEKNGKYRFAICRLTDAA